MWRSTWLFLTFFLIVVSDASAQDVKTAFFTTSDGVRLHYLEARRGPAIVFIPGWSMPAWIWDAQIKHFSANYRVVALDPRSQGDSDKPTSGNFPERRAQDIKELLDHLKLRPAVLVGWSLAVAELLIYAERFGGDSVRVYVLVDGFAWDKEDPQFVLAMLGSYRALQVNRREFTDKFVRGMYKQPQPEEYIQRLISASLQMPTDSAVAVSVGSTARADWRPAVAKLDRPVLVVCEKAMKPFAADLIQSMIPTARVELFEDVGHALFVDAGARFNTVLRGLSHSPVRPLMPCAVGVGRQGDTRVVSWGRNRGLPNDPSGGLLGEEPRSPPSPVDSDFVVLPRSTDRSPLRACFAQRLHADRPQLVPQLSHRLRRGPNDKQAASGGHRRWCASRIRHSRYRGYGRACWYLVPARRICWAIP